MAQRTPATTMGVQHVQQGNREFPRRPSEGMRQQRRSALQT